MNAGDVIPEKWRNDISEILIGSTQLSKRVSHLAQLISTDYESQNPILLVVLKGSFHFASDLSRAITVPHELEFIRAKSYQGVTTSGNVHIQHIDETKFFGRHVIVIEDIVETGLTLTQIYRSLKDAHAASIKCCSLLEKVTSNRIEGSPTVDYIAFHIPDKFVVGYGLDYDQAFRHFPFIAVYKSS